MTKANKLSKTVLRLAGLLLAGVCLYPGELRAQETLKINGSTTVNLPAAEAAEILRAEKGMSIQVDTLRKCEKRPVGEFSRSGR
jgi:hypothetical protein